MADEREVVDGKRSDSPILGHSQGGYETHDDIKSLRERVGWLHTNEDRVVEGSGRETYEKSLEDAKERLKKAMREKDS